MSIATTDIDHAATLAKAIERETYKFKLFGNKLVVGGDYLSEYDAGFTLSSEDAAMRAGLAIVEALNADVEARAASRVARKAAAHAKAEAKTNELLSILFGLADKATKDVELSDGDAIVVSSDHDTYRYQHYILTRADGQWSASEYIYPYGSVTEAIAVAKADAEGAVYKFVSKGRGWYADGPTELATVRKGKKGARQFEERVRFYHNYGYSKGTMVSRDTFETLEAAEEWLAELVNQRFDAERERNLQTIADKRVRDIDIKLLKKRNKEIGTRGSVARSERVALTMRREYTTKWVSVPVKKM